MYSRLLLSLGLAVLNVVVFFFLMWGQNGWLSLRDLKQQLVQLQEDKVKLDARNLRLSHEIRLLKTDKEFQKKMIRLRLRYIRDNELVYIFDD